MPPSDNDTPRFLRPAPSPNTGADTPEYLADEIADRVVDHLPDAVQARVRDTVHRPLARRVGRVLLIALLTLYFVFGALVLTLRYVVLPEVAQYRPQIERLLSRSLQRPVAIRDVEAYWVGLQPALRLSGVTLLDGDRRPALQLERVDARLAWNSFAFMELRLAALEILQPELQVRRNAAGHLFVAGIEITQGAKAQASDRPDGGHSFADWLLAQKRITIRDAIIEWHDDARAAPPLRLTQVNLQLENGWRHHRIGFTAQPPATLATRLDVRGEFNGDDLSRLSQWQGDGYIDVEDADLAVWQRWVDYPLEIPTGRGGVRLWFGFADGGVHNATAQVRIADTRLRLGADLPALDLALLSGRIAASRKGNETTLRLDDFGIVTRDGIRIAPTRLGLKVRDERKEQRVDITANQLDLEPLTRLAAHLPLTPAVADALSRHAARGQIHALKAGWRRAAGTEAGLADWHVDARFDALAWQGDGEIPGADGLSGEIHGDRGSGRLTLTGKRATVNAPALFPDGPVRLDTLDAAIEWAGGNDRLAVDVRRLRIVNDDLAAEANGNWRATAEGPGHIDLTARIERARADAAARYVPASLPDTRSWLAHALKAGRASNGRLTLKGDLAKFPFRDPASGVFEVRAQVAGGTLDFAEGWPAITNIDAELLFTGPTMRITAKGGRIFGTSIRQAVAEIADLEATTVLTVRGQVAGPTGDFLRYIEASPVGGMIDHATRELAAEGNGLLDLDLYLPLYDMDASRVAGSYRFDDNRAFVDPALPWLTNLRGTLRFTHHDVSARGLTAQLIGTPIAADLRSSEAGVQLALKGEISAEALRRELAMPVFDHLSGSARWSGTLLATRTGTQMSLASDLAGLASRLPAPFAKLAAEKRRLSLERKPVAVSQRPNYSRGDTAARADLALTDLRLADTARALLLSDPSRPGAPIVRGAIALGRDNAALPERDIVVQVDLPRIDLDFWRAALARKEPAADAAAGLPVRFEVNTAQLALLGREIENAHVSGDAIGPMTRADVRSARFSASLAYDSRGKGRLTGNIPLLAIAEPVASLDLPKDGPLTTRDVITQLPAIDLRIDRLTYKDRDFGTLTLNAENRSGGTAQWNAHVLLKNPDATLDATLAWLPDEPSAQSQIAFALDVRNIEKTLARVGYPDAVKRGDANLDGTLAWTGSPVDVDYATLTGGMQLTTGKGQFNKLEPGVGRLLGILSLQSLPRRITLDFRDIFSEGFAFDRIDGDLNVHAGIMRTEDLEVRGPAARVYMNGEVDLARETQNLKVRVQPSLSDTVAIGAMLAANPVAGAVAWAAQKLLSDPIDQLFAYDYVVTGDWREPKVDKLGSEAKPAPKAP